MSSSAWVNCHPDWSLPLVLGLRVRRRLPLHVLGPVGTAVEVANLFFNTPVRMKFLRTTQTEFGHVAEAFTRISTPFREFMLANVREKDLKLFSELRKTDPSTMKDGPRLDILVPAFMTSELRRGFEIGFLIVVPFLAIDLIVAVITMSMGMMMLPPTTIALPAKVLFFILIDGWNLLVGSLIRSYG